MVWVARARSPKRRLGAILRVADDPPGTGEYVTSAARAFSVRVDLRRGYQGHRGARHYLRRPHQAPVTPSALASISPMSTKAWSRSAGRRLESGLSGACAAWNLAIGLCL